MHNESAAKIMGNVAKSLTF